MNEVLDFININRDRYVDELKQYLAIPSISALPQHTEDVRRAAEWTADALRKAGMQNVRLVDTPGHPVVYGDWLGALWGLLMIAMLWQMPRVSRPMFWASLVFPAYYLLLSLGLDIRRRRAA